jgi:hypothetical protein
MWYAWGGEMHAGVWWGNVKKNYHFEGLDGRTILKWILMK